MKASLWKKATAAAAVEASKQAADEFHPLHHLMMSIMKYIGRRLAIATGKIEEEEDDDDNDNDEGEQKTYERLRREELATF
ncbi:hypothetical protein T02_8971 [Trichinella nativa]|uniref:Uncharacterized protein n=1 Tax=Trichinella nativa TaxID=6335 RepID=A0A0V1KVK8_9BILA|nr:hypothetical protein T02_8971 [Trichinella nativa]